MYYSAVRNTYKGKGRQKKSSFRIKMIVITVFLLLSLTIVFAINSQGSKVIEYQQIVVEQGDTLWSIASRYNQENQDTRRIINQIKRINKLDDVILQPGQTIRVP